MTATGRVSRASPVHTVMRNCSRDEREGAGSIESTQREGAAIQRTARANTAQFLGSFEHCRPQRGLATDVTGRVGYAVSESPDDPISGYSRKG